ncbi:MAG: hypothetical protein PVI70_02095 [Gammaproteobacteria bacterium]
MANTALLADLEKAVDPLGPLDESPLDFGPDPRVSADIRELTSLQSYPTESHLANRQARIEAVVEAGERLESRAPPDCVSKPAVACVRLAPPGDE